MFLVKTTTIKKERSTIFSPADPALPATQLHVVQQKQRSKKHSSKSKGRVLTSPSSPHAIPKSISTSQLKTWLMSVLRISPHRASPVSILTPHSTPNLACNRTLRPSGKLLNREVPRVIAYLKLLDSHREFFKGCPEIDQCLIAMAYIYLQRATPSISPEGFSTELLFFALYLAWETEEDSTIGVEGIVHYIVGPFPSSKGKDKATRKVEIVEWKQKLQIFHTGKDRLWKALDYRTFVDQSTIAKFLKLVPADHPVSLSIRRKEHLHDFFS